MLMKSGINPFDSQEAKPYKNDGEILAMTNLVTAYQNNDINEFEKILKVFYFFSILAQSPSIFCYSKTDKPSWRTPSSGNILRTS